MYGPVYGPDSTSAQTTHLLQVEELISRIQGALPDCPLVGGLLQPNAWGDNPWGGKRSLRGAVFLNSKVHDEGAVGCFMKGPIQVTQRHVNTYQLAASDPNLGLSTAQFAVM